MPTRRCNELATRSRVWLIALVFLTVLTPGCAAPARRAATSELISEADWPPRITDGLARLAADTPEVLEPEATGGSEDSDSGRDASTDERALRVVRRMVCGVGVVLEVTGVDTRDPSPPTGETELVFVSFSPTARDDTGRPRGSTRLPERISLSDVRAGVIWKLYEPSTGPARGLIVHLGGNKYVRRALLKRGWAVLSSSGTGRYSLRRTSNPVFEIEAGAGVASSATELAAIFDDELADWPYSLEAVLEFLSEKRPDFRQEPRAVMGFSIGALGLPAVVARMPDRFGAAVIVAGGANLLEIARRSRKEHRGIQLRWAGSDPTPEDWREFNEAYLAQVKLDPYRAAAALRGMPVAVYQGQLDQVVPAATGEALCARLEAPERFIFPVGHGQLLRIVMRFQADTIAAWTEAALGDSAAKRGATSPD